MARITVRSATRWLAAPLCVVAVLAAQDPAPATDLLERAKTALAATDYRAAAPLFQQCLARADAAGDAGGAAAALRGLAVAQWGQGQYADGLVTQDRALALSRSRHDVDGERTALNGIGLDHYSLGHYAEALRQYQLALEADRAAPSEKFQGLVWANIGLVYRYQGKFDEAYQAFTTSLALRRTAGDEAGVAQTLNHLGIVSRATGQYDRAIAYYEESAAARRRTGDKQGEAQTLNNLGNVYLDLGQHERAIQAYADAQRIAEAIGYRMQIALSNANIAQALENLGRNREALARTTAALDVYRALGRRASVVDALRGLGELHAELGDAAAARAALTDSLDQARAIGDPQQQAAALLQLGMVAATADPAEARAHFDEALALARTAGLRDLTQDVLVEQGRASLAAGKLDAAIAELGEAAAIVNDLRSAVPSDAGKIGFVDRRRRVFADLVSALTLAGRPEAALEAAESGRARAFGDLLGARTIAASGRTAERVSGLRRALDVERASDGSASDRAGVEAAVGALRATSAELASLMTVEAPRIDELRATAKALNATLVEYLVGEDRVYVWVLDPAGHLHEKVLSVAPKTIDAETRSLRSALDVQSGSLSAATRGARWFHAALIDPIAGWLPTQPDDLVVVVPDGPLALVPFTAFTGRDGRALVERHTIAEAPALSIFKYTIAKAAASAPLRDGRALVVAGPSLPAAGSAGDLPGARREAAAIAAILGAARVDVLTAARATEARVKRDAGRYALVHLATHGLISAEHPLASSLVLAPGDGDDGYLRVDEVFGLELRARLVVLSGCSTGLGRLSADGVLGLTRAFIYAGTPAVIVSQWDIADRATAALMTRFYRALSGGLDPVHALRRAQLGMRAAGAPASRWAGFTFVGDPR